MDGLAAWIEQVSNWVRSFSDAEVFVFGYCVGALLTILFCAFICTPSGGKK